MPNDKSAEVMIEQGRILKLEVEPRDLFAVITGLKLQQFSPMVRVFDPEMRDWTCWQPTEPDQERKAA